MYGEPRREEPLARRGLRARPRALPALLPAPMAVLCLRLGAMHPLWVESFFSRTWYPAWTTRFSKLSARVPGTLAETLALLLLALTVLGTLGCLVRCAARRRLRPLLRWAFALVCGAGALYAAFVLLWGIQFTRMPFADSAHMTLAPADAPELAELCDALLRDALALRGRAPEDAQGAYARPANLPALLAKIPGAYGALSAEYPFLAGDYASPREAVFGEALSEMQIMGIYIPYTGEALVNAGIPATQLAHTAAHEAAHQHGFAREAEADFVGYLACMASGDPELAYSGTLTMLRYAALALSEADPAAYSAVAGRFSAGILIDYERQVSYWRRYETPIAGLVSLTNDRYLQTFALKTDAQDRGDDVVALLLAYRRQAER